MAIKIGVIGVSGHASNQVKVVLARAARKIMPDVPAVQWVQPEPAWSWFINAHCSQCGCRLRTDDKNIWCSSLFHPWHESKEDFMRLAKQTTMDGKPYWRRTI
jgi:hypothetical protein